MSHDPATVRMMDNWALCRPLKPSTERPSGLIMPKDHDKGVVSEGVAEVLAIGKAYKDTKKGRVYYDHGITVGSRVLYRQFLRFAQKVDSLFGGENDFLLSINDILAVVDGEGALGLYDEFRL